MSTAKMASTTRKLSPPISLKAVPTKKVDTQIFSEIVSGIPIAGAKAIQSIREGYPAAVLKAASGFFEVPESRIQKIAHVPASTANRLQKNESLLDSGATERVYRMGTVTRMAIDVFQSETAAVAWMRQPNLALGDAAPLDLMDTEPGAVSVRQVLNAIATGGVA
ncbi:MAG: antitoxin Xre/MbcA/ParS toxin-binding domain-containing protein [Pseudomonadota bacterium]